MLVGLKFRLPAKFQVPRLTETALNYFSGRMGWLDNLEIRQNSAQTVRLAGSWAELCNSR